MSLISYPFGTVGTGTQAHLFVLGNEGGMLVGVSDLGANLVSCKVPDGRGSFPDVLLGHCGAAGYLDDGLNLGAVVGRCANRIAGACFEIDGTSYQLAANDGPNSLHSGPDKWSERLWRVARVTDSSITFELLSPDGDQGFPGKVRVQVTYLLHDDNSLEVSYHATPSKPTIINLTSHAYWNLNGHAAGSVLDHTLRIGADSYTPMVGHLPTGQIAPVEGTPYDFRTDRTIGACLDTLPGGYDDNFCLDNGGQLREAATLVGDRTGISMTVSTDSCGMQVFTADFLDVPWAKDGARYGAFAGVALETQHHPDAIHHSNFPQPLYCPDHPFAGRTVFAFGTAGR